MHAPITELSLANPTVRKPAREPGKCSSNESLNDLDFRDNNGAGKACSLLVWFLAKHPDKVTQGRRGLFGSQIQATVGR